MKALVDAFQAEYPGLEVETLRLTSGELAVRYSQERDANAQTADVITISDKAFTDDGVAKGWFQRFPKTELPATAVLEDRWFDEGLGTTLLFRYGIAYNTDLVPQAPTSWEDVLKPEYQGKIVYPDFRNASVYGYYGRYFMDRYGEDYLRRLKALNPIMADSMVPGIQQVGSGQAALAFPAASSTVDDIIAAGAPIKMAFPEDYVGVDVVSAISANTRSPGFSRLFYDFLFTERGQEALIAAGAVSPINSKGSLPLGSGYVAPRYDTLPSTLETMQSIFNLS